MLLVHQHSNVLFIVDETDENSTRVHLCNTMSSKHCHLHLQNSELQYWHAHADCGHSDSSVQEWRMNHPKMIMEEVDMVVQEGTPEAACCTIWKTCAGMITLRLSLPWSIEIRAMWFLYKSINHVEKYILQVKPNLWSRKGI